MSELSAIIMVQKLTNPIKIGFLVDVYRSKNWAFRLLSPFEWVWGGGRKCGHVVKPRELLAHLSDTTKYPRSIKI